MFRLLTTFLTGCSVVLSLTCSGQGRTEIPLGAMPMQYNPSFAGQVGGPRVSSNFRYGKGKHENMYDNSRSHGYSVYTSYDQFFPAIRSGIGVTAGYGGGNNKFNYSDGGINYSYNSSSNLTSLSIAIAPKISLKGKYTLSPSGNFSYRVEDTEETTNLVPNGMNGRYYSLDSRAGLLFNTNKFYISYSVNLFHQTKWKAGYFRSSGFNSDIQLGYTFQRSLDSKFSFTPQVVLQISRNNYEHKTYFLIAAYNFNFRYKQFIWGFNNEGLHLGWQTDKFRLMVTNNYGFTTRDEFDYTGNLSFRYLLGSKDQRPGRGW